MLLRSPPPCLPRRALQLQAARRDDEVLRLFEEKCDEEVTSGFARWISAGSACPCCLATSARCACQMSRSTPACSLRVFLSTRVSAGGRCACLPLCASPFLVVHFLAWRRSGWLHAEKIRQIGDFSASRINSTTVLPEKLRMGNLDGVVQMIRAEVRSLSLASQTTSLPTLARQVDAANGEPVDIVFDKEDFVNAFKTLPIRAEDQPLFVTTWGGADARRQALQLLSMPFGATASVHGWERFAVGLQMVMVRPAFRCPRARLLRHILPFAGRRVRFGFWPIRR